MEVSNEIINIIPEIKTWRHELHAHPELGYEEKWTSDFVAKPKEPPARVYWTKSSTLTLEEAIGDPPTLEITRWSFESISACCIAVKSNILTITFLS